MLAALLDELNADALAITEILEDLGGPLPWGSVRVELMKNDAVDALAERGRVLLSPRVAVTEDLPFRWLTLSHECAHQYWGLLVRTEAAFLREPMAEFWALRVIEKLGGDAWLAPMLRCARGQLAASLFHADGPIERRWLGRDTLALYAMWRHNPSHVDDALRTAITRARTGSATLDALWRAMANVGCELQQWACTSAIPQPRIVEDTLLDIADTGLATLVSLDLADGQCMDVWLTGPMAVPSRSRISDDQRSPVLAGLLVSDLEYFRHRDIGRQTARPRRNRGPLQQN